MGLKLYALNAGPPSLAVMMCLKALDVKYDLVPVNWFKDEHKTEAYANLNPQMEIPVLDDDGFFLSESNAILQYICEKYGRDDKLYPKDPKARAIVNHRLCFNLASYYTSIGEHVFMGTKTDKTAEKLIKNLSVFNVYLRRIGTKYAAGDNLTIADLQLVTATMSLEAAKFDINSWPLVEKWYCTFKREYPDLWAITEKGMMEIAAYIESELYSNCDY